MPIEAVTALPDSPVLADEAAGRRAAYVHVPFCHRVCPYCDFAVVEGSAGAARERYVRALHGEIEAEDPWPGRPLDAIYVGGGTPSLLPSAALGSLVEALRDRFGLHREAEVSIEANPEDWTAELAAGLAGAGFTRVSLGAQSFDPVVLQALGRRHRPEDAEEAVAVARREGFGTVNVDLIFGTPVETDASWEESVTRAVESGIDHLSAYALTVERGTALSRSVRRGAAAPDPDVQAERYERLQSRAAASGLVRYETSNWARPGHACRYNLVTWSQGEYLAFGLGAHRHRDGTRSWNVRRLDRYLERVESGQSPVSGGERLEGWQREQERVLLGLRRAAGVEAGSAGRMLLGSARGRRLVAAGVVGERSGRLVVTRPLLGDEVARAVLALAEPDC